MKKILCVLLAAALFCAAACALAQTPATFALGVVITQEGRSPSPIDYTVRLAAQDGAPMPAGQTGGTYDVTLNGPGEVHFPAITYDHVGTYTYTVSQLKGDDKHCEYDPSVYTLTVYVLNKADFSGFDITAVFTDSEGGPKPDNNLFGNIYTPDPENGSITPTGVADHWPKYLAGSAVLFAVSGVLATRLRRREETLEDVVLTEDDEHDAP